MPTLERNGNRALWVPTSMLDHGEGGVRSVIPELGAGGALPPGRYRATVSEVEARYVDHGDFAASGGRREAWQHWCEVTEHLRQIVPVCAAWIGGSFTTGKLEPDDVDVVYVIDSREALEARAAHPGAPQWLAAFATKGAIRSQTGRRVDTFILEWFSLPGATYWDRLPYYPQRGYWDDFWQRVRSGPRGGPPVDMDALPQRGYLEVVLDGWSA